MFFTSTYLSRLLDFFSSCALSPLGYQIWAGQCSEVAGWHISNLAFVKRFIAMIQGGGRVIPVKRSTSWLDSLSVLFRIMFCCIRGEDGPH